MTHHRITARTLCALSTHARNVAKAAEVLGCLKAKPTAKAIDVAVEHRQGCRFLTFKADNGSTLDLPLMGVDAESVDPIGLSLLVGLEAIAKGGNASAAPSVELQAMRAALGKAQAEAAAERKAACQLLDECDQLKATVEELTSALAKAKAAPVAVAPIKARLDAAKAEHGDLLSAIVAETAKAAPVAPTKAAKPVPVAAPVAVAVAAPLAVDPDVAALQELERRADVELESVGNRVVRVVFLPVGGLRGRQGSGVADSLKARGFRYDAKASVNGRLVWVR